MPVPRRKVVLGVGTLWTDGTRYRVELHKKCDGMCDNKLVPLYPSPKAFGKKVRLIAEIYD